MIEPKTSRSPKGQTLARIAILAIGLLAIAGGLYWYLGSNSDETPTITVGTGSNVTAKGGKAAARRFDGIIVTDSATVMHAPEATVQIPMNRKGVSGLPTAKYRVTPNSAPEVLRAERAHQRLLNDPDAAKALGLSDEQLAAIKALEMPLLRLTAGEREQLKSLYDVYHNAGGAAQWGLEPMLLEIAREAALSRLAQTRQDAATMAQQFATILTADQQKQLPDVLATPVKPPATTRAAPASTRAATKPAAAKPATTRAVAPKPSTARASTKAATRATTKPATPTK